MHFVCTLYALCMHFAHKVHITICTCIPKVQKNIAWVNVFSWFLIISNSISHIENHIWLTYMGVGCTSIAHAVYLCLHKSLKNMPSKKQTHQHTPYKFTPREIRILYVIDQKSFPHTYVEQSILQAHMSYEHSARPSTVLQMHMSYEELCKSKLDNPCWSIQTHLSYEHGTRPSAVLQIHMSCEELHGRECTH